jgi:predicted nicotinamide N-methyase
MSGQVPPSEDEGGAPRRVEEEVDYVMQSPFADALPSGEYSHPMLLEQPGAPRRRVIRVHPRAHRVFDGLFADDVWPGAVEMTDFLVEHATEIVRGRRVLELGAGAALPSLACCYLGAALVVSTDFPDESILENMKNVFRENGFPVSPALSSSSPPTAAAPAAAVVVRVLGHEWGQDVEPLIAASGGAGFDVIILAELLWKDTACLHGALLRSAAACLAPGGCVLVSFGERPPASEVAHLGATDTPPTPIREEDFIRLATTAGASVPCGGGAGGSRGVVFRARELRRRHDHADVCSCAPLTVRLLRLVVREGEGGEEQNSFS